MLNRHNIGMRAQPVTQGIVAVGFQAGAGAGIGGNTARLWLELGADGELRHGCLQCGIEEERQGDPVRAT